MNRVALTGATGFVGSHLVEYLIKNGIETVALVRRETPLLNELRTKGLEVVKIDLFDTERVKRYVKGIDTFFHIAGVTKALTFEEYLKVNAELTGLLAQTVPEDVHFVFMSSQACAGPSAKDFPIDENHQENPLTYYGKSKLEGERLLAASRKNYSIIRPSAVFGPRDKDIFEYFKMAHQGWLPIIGNGKKQVSLIYVKDLVKATVTLATKRPLGEIFFACDGNIYDWNAFSEILKIVVNKKIFSFHVPEMLAYPVAFLSELKARIIRKPALLNYQKIIEMKQEAWLCSNQKLQNLGWNPEYTLKKAMKETYTWYLENGWLK